MKKLLISLMIIMMIPSAMQVHAFGDVPKGSELDLPSQLLVNVGIMDSYCDCWLHVGH